MELEWRSNSLGFEPQHEDKYTLLLSKYTTDEKALECLESIKNYLSRSIMTRDVGENTKIWIHRLHWYLNLFGLKISKEDNIALIKILCDFICVEGLELDFMSNSIMALRQLLSKPHAISPSEMTIDWKKLYSLYKRYAIKPPFREISLKKTENEVTWIQKLISKNRTDVGQKVERKILIELKEVISKLKSYFDENATQEIFDQEKSKLYPLYPTNDVMREAIRTLHLFLPIYTVQGASLKHEIWLPKLMALWQSTFVSPFEQKFLDLLSTYSFHHIGLIDWKPYMSFIHTRILANFEFPVKFENSDLINFGGLQSESAAIWVVSTLGGNMDGQYHLTKLMLILKPYFRGVNHGRWTRSLVSFYKNLVLYFIKRIKREKSNKTHWAYKTPENFKLTESDIDEFYNCLFRVPFIESVLLNDSVASLTALRPNIALPMLVSQYEESLQDVCSPFRSMIAVNNIRSASLIFVNSIEYNYPAGRTLVIPTILKLSENLDMNNSSKLWSSLQAIGYLLCQIPIIDSSMFPNPELLTPEEAIINADTSMFEEIVFIVLNTIFSVIDSAAYMQTRLDCQTVEFTAFDKSLLNVMNSFISDLLPNLSKDIFQNCLSKLKDYIFRDVRETKVSAKFIAELAKSFCRCTPSVALPVLLPALCDMILTAVHEDGTIKEDESKEAVLYYLSILSKVVACNRNELIQFGPKFEELFDRIINLDLGNEYSFVSDVLGDLLRSLASRKVFVDPENWAYSITDIDSLPIKDWGLKRKLKDVKIVDTVPGPEEEAYVRKLVHNYIWPSVKFIEDLIKSLNENEGPFSRDLVNHHLKIINSLAFINCHLPKIDEPMLNERDPDEMNHLQTSFVPKLDIKTPCGQNMRTYLLKLMNSTYDKLSMCDEDNTIAFEKMIEIYSRILLTGRKWSLVGEKSQTRSFDMRYRNPILPFPQFHSLPYINAKLEFRLKKIRFFEPYSLTETVSESIKTLLNLGLSCYPKVGNDARSVLTMIVNECPRSNDVILPFIEEQLLLKHPINSTAYKGLLNTIFSFSSSIFKKREVISSTTLWMKILTIDVPEERSCIDLINCFRAHAEDNNFLHCWFFEIPDDFVASTSSLWKKLNVSSFAAPSSQEIEAGKIRMLEKHKIYEKKYLSLIESLLEPKNLHWRFEILRMVFLQKLTLPDIMVPIEVLQYILDKLFDSSVTIRQEAMLSYSHVISKFEERPKPVVETREFLGTDANIEKWSPGEDSISDIIQYKSDHPNPKIVHKVHEGFTCWSKTISDPIRPYVPIPTVVDFWTPEKVSKFYKLILCHSTNDTSLCSDDIHFFKHIFKNSRPSIELFLKQAATTVTSSDPSEQCFAAEVISGVAMAMKYWDVNVQSMFWKIIISLLRKAIENLSPTLELWCQCIYTISANRDPNSMEPLFDYLLSWDFDTDVHLSTIIHRKTFCLTNAMIPECWKIASLNNLVLEKLLPFLNHPYQSYRTSVSGLLHSIFISDNGFDGINTNRSPRFDKFFNDIIYPRIKMLEELKPIDPAGEEKYENSKFVFKTVCRWLVLVSKSPQRIWPLAYKLVPALCQTKRDDPNSETALLSMNMLGFLARNVLIKDEFQMVFDHIVDIFINNQSLANYAKVALIHFSQVFIFYNIPHLAADQARLNKINDIIFDVLNYNDIDVKLAAKGLLRDLIKCGLSYPITDLISYFNSDSKDKSLRQRSVLGFIAVVDAHPYTIPDYMTQVFEFLSNHLSDPNPIPTWIAAAVDSFRHTQPDKELLSRKIPSELLQVLSSSKLTYFS